MIPWPLFCLLTVGIVAAFCVPLTALLARTPLAGPLTGRRQVRWSRAAGSVAGRTRSVAGRARPVATRAQTVSAR